MKFDGMIKVSVSMITYNHEHYIAQAIESVLSQKTDFVFELVISDDASTDGTRQVITTFAQKYPDVIKLKNRDTNLGLVRNALQTISDCQGEYIALLEGDDYWVDDYKLQRQVDFLNMNEDCAYCFTNGMKFWDGTDKTHICITAETPEKFDLQYFLTKNVNLLNNTKMFRKSVHPESFSPWFYETVQWDWSLHVLHARNGMIGYLDFVSTHYRRHDQAFIVSSNAIDLYNSGLRTLHELNKELNYKYEDYFSQTWWHYEQLALVYLGRAKVKNFIKNLLLSFMNRPFRNFQEYRDLVWKIRHSKKK